jgi:nicotinamidase-related amidase
MKVLVIIDMLNGFCREGYPLSLPEYHPGIEAYIKNRIEMFLANNDKVVFVCDNHSLSDPEINNPYPPHCMKGTVEEEIIDSLVGYKKDATIIHKNTISILYQTNLEALLSEWQPEQIEITGVCTDVCDLLAVYELRIRGYKVVVSKQGVLPLKPENQDFFLDYFKTMLSVEIL